MDSLLANVQTPITLSRNSKLTCAVAAHYPRPYKVELDDPKGLSKSVTLRLDDDEVEEGLMDIVRGWEQKLAQSNGKKK